MSLQAKLDAFKADLYAGRLPFKPPAEVLATMDRTTQALIASGADAKALKVGDKAPSFTLPDPDKNPVSSAALLAKGPLAISFYRGVWCPYCNMELQALQETLGDIRAAGGNLIAISPQLPPNSRKAMQQNKLTFPILSDMGNETAARFGLKFALPPELIEVYKGFGNDLALINGEPSWTLPMPGRFVIGTDGTIRYAEVNPDYTKRPEPSALLPALRAANLATT